MIQTSYGVWEKRGESKWQSPYHQTAVEVETHKGVKRRHVEGLKGFNYNNALVSGPLTNRAIDKYVKDGTYAIRHQLLAERRQNQAIGRMIYDPSTQEFV